MPTENNPSTIAVLRLDEGVNNDLVVATSGDATWTLHRGNGDFSFGKSTDVPLSGRAHNVALADLDLDSVPDLCVVHGNSISVALGQQDGTFGPITTIPSTQWGSFVGIGDLNRDGAPDIIVCGQLGFPAGLPTFHPGNGDGTFGPSSTVSTPAACSAVALDDFDGDGILDAGFAYGRRPSHVAIFLGQADGTLLPGAVSTCDMPEAGWTGGIASADLNGDEVPDIALAIGYASGGVCVFEGNGDGTFAPAVTYPVPYASTVRIGDVTSDGYDDLVCTTTNYALVAILPGRGDGTFGPRTDIPAKGIPRYLDLADLNNDGLLDIVYPNAGGVGTVSVFLGSGAGSFEPRLDLGVDEDPVSAAVDLDRDGYLDIVSANDDGWSISILMHRGVLSVDVVHDAGSSTPPAGDLDVVVQASGAVRVRYRLATALEGVRLDVYDVRGRLVRSLDAGQRDAGQHEISWNRTTRTGHKVSSGVYFVHLEAGMECATRKVLLIGRR